jgi:DNA modification methylase
MDIRENDTLNGQKGKESARSEDDVKHIAPLQLEVIERLVRLYSNPGEIVFSPFAGIGSELVTALKLGRRAYGCELKPEYYHEAIRNCERAIVKVQKTGSLFD